MVAGTKKLVQPRQQPLANGDGWPDPIPENVQKAADEYTRKLRAYNKLKGELNTAKDNVREAMSESEIEAVPVDNGAKMLRMYHNDTIKLEKVKTPSAREEE